MQTYEIAVVNRSVRGNSDDMTLVRTSVGIDQVHVLFDNAEWLDFPVTISFGQGPDLITQSLIVSGIEGSTEWVAESTVLIPHEVIDMTGSIRVTIQGTDADGRHIITAYGAPLSVEEAGDVMQGDVPEDAPTPDQWHQAYAEAQVAINEMITVRDNAQAVVDALQSRLDELVAQASAALDDRIEAYRVPATTERLGMVKVGDGLAVTEDGTLSSLRTNGITQEQINVIANTQLLATKAFDTTFDEDTGALVTARLKSDAMPEDYDPGISADDIGAGLALDEDGKLTIHGGGNVTTDEDGVLNVDVSAIAGPGLAVYTGTPLIETDPQLTLDDDTKASLRKIDGMPGTMTVGSAEDADEMIAAATASTSEQAQQFMDDYPGGAFVMAPGRIALIKAEMPTTPGGDYTVAVTDIYDANA